MTTPIHPDPMAVKLPELPELPECWTGSPVTVTWAEDGETTTREVYIAEQMYDYALDYALEALAASEPGEAVAEIPSDGPPTSIVTWLRAMPPPGTKLYAGPQNLSMLRQEVLRFITYTPQDVTHKALRELGWTAPEQPGKGDAVADPLGMRDTFSGLTKSGGFTIDTLLADFDAAPQPSDPAEGDARAKFERWVAKRHGCSTERWADSGEYQYHDTRNWWQCWQAALSTPPPAIAQAQGAEYQFEVWQGGAWQASGDAADLATAIREASHYEMMYGQDGPVEVRYYARYLITTDLHPAARRGE